MCHKSVEFVRSESRSIRRQAGFLIPIALFIVTGLSVLVLAMARVGSATQSAVIQESISTQALLAAESGSQYGLGQLLFDVTNQSQVDSNCASIDSSSISFTAVGLVGCSAALVCELIDNSGGSAHIYELKSTSSCGTGDFLAQRIISVKASFE